MSLDTLHWFQRLDALTTNQPDELPRYDTDPGLVLDSATAPWTSADKEALKVLQHAQDISQAAQGIHSGGIMSDIGQIVGLGDPVFKALIWPYRKLSTEVVSPITHLLPVAASAEYQNAHYDSWWDQMYGLWHQADVWAQKDSLGRGVLDTVGVTADSVLFWNTEPGKLNAFKKGGVTREDFDKYQNSSFDMLGLVKTSTLSGGTDFAANFFLDPLVILGKVGKAVGGLRATKPLSYYQARDMTPEQIVQLGPVQRFLSWSDGRTASQIVKHPAIKDEPQAGQIADLLARSTREDKEYIWRIGVGDQEAYDQLRRISPGIHAEWLRLRSQSDALALQLRQTRNPTPEMRDAYERNAMRLQHLERDSSLELNFHRSEWNPGQTFASFDEFTRNPFAVTFASQPIGPSLATLRVGAEPAAGSLLAGSNGARNSFWLTSSLHDVDRWAQDFRLHHDLRTSQSALTDPRARAITPAIAVEGTTGAARNVPRGPEGPRRPRGQEIPYRFYTLDEVHNPINSLNGRLLAPTARGRTAPVDLNRAFIGRYSRSYEDGLGITRRVTADTPGAVQREMPVFGNVDGVRQITGYRTRWVMPERTLRIGAARQRQLPGMPTVTAQRDMAAFPHTWSGPLPAAAYFDPTQAAQVADEVAGQLNLLDDLITPELINQDLHFGELPGVVNRTEDLARGIKPETGIFMGISRVPRKGWGGLSEAAVRRADLYSQKYLKTTRGARAMEGVTKQQWARDRNAALDQWYQDTYQRRMWLRRSSFLARPVQFLDKLERFTVDNLTGTAIPNMIDTKSFESWKTLDQWLRQVKMLEPQVREAFVRQHMALTNPGDKLAHIEQVEASVLQHMMDNIGGITPETARQVIEVTLGTRQGLVRQITNGIARAQGEGASIPYGSESAVFSATTDPAGRRVDMLGPNGEALVATPLLRSQLIQEHALLPLPDVQRALWMSRNILQGDMAALGSAVGKSAQLAQDFSALANQIWKGTVLFRPAYMFRTVSDEMLVAMSVMGGLLYVTKGVDSLGHAASNVALRARNVGRRATNANRRARGDLNRRELERPDSRRGTQDIVIGEGDEAIRIPGAFSGAGEDPFRALTSTAQERMYGVYGSTLDQLRNRAYVGVLDPVANRADHIPAWAHALNNQFGGDLMARRALEYWGRGLNSSVGIRAEEHATRIREVQRALMHWLRTPEGQRYAAGNTLASANRTRWTQDVAAMVDHYTVGNPELVGLALERRVRPEDLERIPLEMRPSVHGGEIDYTLGYTTLQKFRDGLFDNAYKFLNQLPTDKLVRHPVADFLYSKRVRELAAGLKGQGVALETRPDLLYHLEETARQWTVKEMRLIFKDHLFASPPSALRFIMPFFGAWRASLARWARVIGEDPSVIGRFSQGWQGLHKPFDVVDEDGNEVENSNLDAYGIDTKNKIRLRLPEWAAKRMNMQYAPARDMSLKSLNTVLQGDQWYNAGFGPFLTIPLSEIFKHNPAAQENSLVKAVLPYGSQPLANNLFPSTVRNAQSAEAGMDNATYANRFVNILRVEVTNYRTGYRDTPPTLDEIKKKTEAVGTLDFWARMFSPGSLQDVYYDKRWEKDAPKGYQFLAGKLRDYRSKATKEVTYKGQTFQIPDYEAGTEQFLNEFPEALAWLESVSENRSGIPASFSAWDKSQRVKRLATTAPDIFASVAGVTEWDKLLFSAEVYNAQKSEPFGAAGMDRMREPRDVQDIYQSMRTQSGWREFAKMSNAIQAMVDERELPSIYAPGAEDLLQAKKDMAKEIGEKFPAWYQEYLTPDPNRMSRVIDQVRIVTKDKGLLTDQLRPDMKMLARYLAIRDQVAAELRNRKMNGGSSDLTAKSNELLMKYWDEQRGSLGQQVPQFQDLWLDRYFDRDYLPDVAREAIVERTP